MRGFWWNRHTHSCTNLEQLLWPSLCMLWEWTRVPKHLWLKLADYVSELSWLYFPFSCTQNDPGELATDTDPDFLQEIAKQPTGMQDTDLRSMKDQLLIETSEMLGVGKYSVCVHSSHVCNERVWCAWKRETEREREQLSLCIPHMYVHAHFMSVWWYHNSCIVTIICDVSLVGVSVYCWSSSQKSR